MGVAGGVCSEDRHVAVLCSGGDAREHVVPEPRGLWPGGLRTSPN